VKRISFSKNPELASACGCCSGGMHHAKASSGLSRRSMLWTGIAGAIAATAFASEDVAFAQTALSPEAALQALLDGNKRFVAKRLNSCSEDLALLKENTINKQEPFARILSCADSRVPVELIFDQSIGQLFVTRVAGKKPCPARSAPSIATFAPPSTRRGPTSMPRSKPTPRSRRDCSANRHQ